MVSKLSIPNHLFQTFYLKSTKQNRRFYTILTNRLLQSTHPKESFPYNTIKIFHSIPSAPNYLSKPSIPNNPFQTNHSKSSFPNPHPINQVKTIRWKYQCGNKATHFKLAALSHPFRTIHSKLPNHKFHTIQSKLTPPYDPWEQSVPYHPFKTNHSVPFLPSHYS
jgi:hypothetical protein